MRFHSLYFLYFLLILYLFHFLYFCLFIYLSGFRESPTSMHEKRLCLVCGECVKLHYYEELFILTLFFSFFFILFNNLAHRFFFLNLRSFCLFVCLVSLSRMYEAALFFFLFLFFCYSLFLFSSRKSTWYLNLKDFSIA